MIDRPMPSGCWPNSLDIATFWIATCVSAAANCAVEDRVRRRLGSIKLLNESGSGTVAGDASPILFVISVVIRGSRIRISDLD